MVAIGISLMSICCLRIRSSSRSRGPSYCSRWKFSGDEFCGDDTTNHDSMGPRWGRLSWPARPHEVLNRLGVQAGDHVVGPVRVQSDGIATSVRLFWGDAL